MELDLRSLALTIAKAHDLPLDVVVMADEVSKNDEDFLTAICASADLEDILQGYTQ
jgi:hypothetical protein